MTEAPPTARKSPWRWLRLGAFMFVICGLSVWWEIRQVSADFSERSLSFGRQIEKLSELERNTTTFELNGARMTLTTAMRDEAVGALLDRFGALCARDSGGISEQLDELAKAGGEVPKILQKGSFGIFRAEEADEGTTACFARNDGGGLLETVRRLSAVLDDGDFSRLGQLRYMFVRKSLNGQSHVVSVTSLGTLKLDKMFPSGGDAPGRDLIDGVRPPSSRRLLSMRVEGTKQQAVMYESLLPPDDAVLAFDPPYKSRGFSVGKLDAVKDDLAAATRVYLRDDETVLVIGENGRGRRTGVWTFRLPGGGFERVKMPFAQVSP